MTQLTLTSNQQHHITPFAFDDYAVRALTINGEPWFVAADVCEALGLGNATMALARLDDDEQALISIEGISRGNDQVNVINESGLYSLTLGSRKIEAKRFKKWVTSEVLPSIRKTGSYQVAGPSLDTEEGKLLMIQDLAAKQLALIHENKQIAIERDHAIKTKAQIGNKREATSMAKVAVVNRENAKLRDQLGFSARHATILQVEDAVGGDFGFVELRRWCKANEVTPQTVPDKRYPAGVKAWPAGAWLAVYGVDLVELFGAEVA